MGVKVVLNKNRLIRVSMRLMLILTLTLNLPQASLAKGMDDQLESFFNSMGYKTNFTGAGAYESQSGGYYTGGSIFARAPSSNTQLANIQMPSFRAGCGGIDLFKGAFSFINAQGLISMLRDIGSGASGYAFNLALQTITPQIYNTLTELNAIAQRVNNMNINSCEAAATALGGVWPKTDSSSRLLCNAMGTSGGEGNVFKDWAASRQGCGAEDRRNEVNDTSKGNEQFKEIIGDEFNLAWRALKKMPFLSEDDELAEFFMSISGSIISKKVKEAGGKSRFEKTHLASLAGNQELINMLIFGEKKSVAEAQIYKCDDTELTKCLNPVMQTLNVTKDKALIVKVEALMKSLADKIRSGTDKPTEEEKGLVESTKIPILKILAVQTAFKSNTETIGISEISEAIAHDLVLQLLDRVLDTVLQSIKHLQQVQIDDSIISEFKSDIARSKHVVLEKRNGAFQQMNAVLSLIERTRQIEKQLHHMFIEYNDIEA
jgi:conjugative transfer pilus assembly protein TraH